MRPVTQLTRSQSSKGRRSPSRAGQRLANVAADAVFLVVEAVLLKAADVAMVTPGVVALLLADAPVGAVQVADLPGAQLAVAPFDGDQVVLMGQTVIDLFAAGMMSVPLRFGRGRGGGAQREHKARPVRRMRFLLMGKVLFEIQARPSAAVMQS